MRYCRKARPLFLIIMASVMLASCDEPAPGRPDQAAPPPPAIDVAQVLQQRITEWDQFTGRLQAPGNVTLIPRVSGYIESVDFQEGAFVNRGDTLFTIDSHRLDTEVERLEAELKRAQSVLVLAKSDLARAEELFKKKAISEELNDSRIAQKQQAEARVISTGAALERARIDVSHTRVKAPVSGRVSLANVTVGNYVTAGETQLTSIVSTSQMYAYFDVDELSYLRYTTLSKQNKRQDPRSGDNPVFMALANESDFNHVGVIDFVDNRMDEKNGTIRLRARFDNHQNQLIPGLYARIRLVGSEAYQGILIDDKAIGTDLSNRFVLVVDDQNRLEYRPVTLGKKLSGLRIITSGLLPGDRIAVNGLQKVRPGMSVTPNLIDMASAETRAALRQAQQVAERSSHSQSDELTDSPVRD